MSRQRTDNVFCDALSIFSPRMRRGTAYPDGIEANPRQSQRLTDRRPIRGVLGEPVGRSKSPALITQRAALHAALLLAVSLGLALSALGQSSANVPMDTTATDTPGVSSQSTPGPSSPAAHPLLGKLRANKQRAVRIILSASRSDNPELRANALEAITSLPKRALPVIQRTIDDKNPAVRFAALVTMGRLKLRSLGPAAARYLDDDNASVRAAAMFALHATGRQPPMNELPRLLGSTDPQTRANAAMLVGLLGEKSAIEMLKDKADQPMPRVGAVRHSLIDLQFSEAMVKLGDHSAIGPIRAAAYSTQYEVRVVAVLTLGRLEDRRMAPALVKLLHDQPVELELAAAQALAQMGDDRGVKTMLAAANYDSRKIAKQTREFLDQHPNSPFAPNHRGLLEDAKARRRVASRARAQAAFALGQSTSPRAAASLTHLLNDASPRVRLAAAAATVQALDERSK